jgi:hypothetical protein
MAATFRTGDRVRVNLKEFGIAPGQVITPVEAQMLRIKGGQRAASFIDTAGAICVAIELYGERVPMAVRADQLELEPAQ